jgi:radical SAM superfamily enzyme YgiQ (UPF0313 family)
MDVLLVNVSLNKVIAYAAMTLPVGLAYLGAVLREAGYDVSAVDLNVTPMDDVQIKKTIEKSSPLILGISTTTPTHLNGLKFARLAKEVNPEIKVVIGGPHASVLYEEVAKEKCVDVVARGEGEYTMLEVADCLIRKRGNLASVKGIAYKDDGAIKVTDKRPFITDPDELPFPARYLFPCNLYGIPNAVLASRGGCPFACYFCAVNNIWEGRRRSRSPEKVLEEILSTVSTFGIKQGGGISFSDDAFTMDRECVIRLCHLIRQSMRLVKQATGFLPLWWRCTTRADLVDAELIKEMCYAGCRSIQYGVEAGSQKILDSIGKRITLDQIRRAVDLTLNSGIDAQCSFMFPHPEDTVQTVREQIRFMQELNEIGANASLGMTTPLPGTYLYENANKLGVKILSKNWDEYDCRHIIITTKNLSMDKLQSLHEEMMQDVGMCYTQ